MLSRKTLVQKRKQTSLWSLMYLRRFLIERSDGKWLQKRKQIHYDHWRIYVGFFLRTVAANEGLGVKLNSTALSVFLVPSPFCTIRDAECVPNCPVGLWVISFSFILGTMVIAVVVLMNTAHGDCWFGMYILCSWASFFGCGNQNQLFLCQRNFDAKCKHQPHRKLCV